MAKKNYCYDDSEVIQFKYNEKQKRKKSKPGKFSLKKFFKKAVKKVKKFFTEFLIPAARATADILTAAAHFKKAFA